MRCSILTLIGVLVLGGSACSAKRQQGTAAITGVTHRAVERSQTVRRSDRQESGVDRPLMSGTRQSRTRPTPPRAGVQVRGTSGSGSSAESHAMATLGADQEPADSALNDPAPSGDAATYGADPVSAAPSRGAADGDASRTGLALLVMSTAVAVAVVVLMSRRFWGHAG